MSVAEAADCILLGVTVALFLSYEILHVMGNGLVGDGVIVDGLEISC